MSQLQTSIIVDLAGNLSQQAERYSRSLENMGQRGQRHMRALGRTVRAVGQGLDRLGNRYTTLFTGAALTLAGRQVVALETRFTRLGIQASRTAEEMDKLKKKIFDIAMTSEIRVDPSQITSAIEAIVEKTGDLKFAEANIRNIGMAIQATGADGAAIGEIMAEFQKMGMVDPKGVMQTLDTLNVQGKEGAFTLQNLAALGPRVITAYTATGRSGAQAMREMGAALQMIRQGTGSSEMAATAFEATMRTLTDPKKIKILENAGIKIFDPEAAKNGKKVLRPINELMTEIIQKVKGDATKLGVVFDAEAVRAFNAAASEFQRTGALSTLQKFMDVQADGSTTMKDSVRAARTSEAALTSLLTAWKKFQDNELTGPIQSAADALNSLEPGTVDRWLQIGKTIAIVGAGAIALRKAGQAYGWLRGIGAGARSGGIGGALAGAAGMGRAQLVYVVNMPGSGLGGMPDLNRAGRLPRFPTFSRARTTAALLGGTNVSRLGMYGAAALGTSAAAVAGAGAAGYGIGTLINEGFKYSDKNFDTNIQSTLADTVGSAIAHTLAAFGNKDAQDSVARMERAQASLKIEVDDKRVRVSNIQTRNIDADVSGSSMGSR